MYLTTGTITTQGNYFQYFSDHEFPSLQSYVNNCAEKFEANTETNNESLKIQSENDATLVKQVVTKQNSSEISETENSCNSSSVQNSSE